MASLRAREERRRQLESVLRRTPHSAEAHANLGSFHWRHERDYRAAVACYERCLDIAPTHVEAINQLALIVLTHRKVERAEELFRRAMAVRPSYCRARRNLATLLRDQRGESAAALALLRETLHLDPGDARGWALLGQWLRADGDYAGAFVAFERCVSVDTTNCIGFEGLAQLHSDDAAGRLNAGCARVFAQSALSVQMHHPDTFITYATVLERFFGATEAVTARRLLRAAMMMHDLRPHHRIKLLVAIKERSTAEDDEDVDEEEPLPSLPLTTPEGISVDVVKLCQLPEGADDVACRRDTWELSGTLAAPTSVDRTSCADAVGTPEKKTSPPAARCGHGHAMWRLRYKPYGFGNTWSCDVCAFGITSADALHCGVYHCPLCEVDLCPTCRRRWTEAAGGFLAPSDATAVAWGGSNDGAALHRSSENGALGFQWGQKRSSDADEAAPRVLECATLGADGTTLSRHVVDDAHWVALAVTLRSLGRRSSDIPLHAGLHESVAASLVAECVAIAAANGETATASVLSPGTVFVRPQLHESIVAHDVAEQRRLLAARGCVALAVVLPTVPHGRPPRFGPLGSLLYEAPEWMLPESYNVAVPADDSDDTAAATVWSAGALLTGLLTGQEPWLLTPYAAETSSGELLAGTGSVDCEQVLSSVFLATHHSDAPVHIDALFPVASARMRAVLHAALEKHYAQRCTLADLEAMLREPPQQQGGVVESDEAYALRVSVRADELESLHGPTVANIKKEQLVTLLAVHHGAVAAGISGRHVWCDDPGPATVAGAPPAVSLGRRLTLAPRLEKQRRPLNLSRAWLALSRCIPLQTTAVAACEQIPLRTENSPGATMVVTRIACLRRAAEAAAMSAAFSAGFEPEALPKNHPHPHHSDAIASPLLTADCGGVVLDSEAARSASGIFAHPPSSHEKRHHIGKPQFPRWATATSSDDVANLNTATPSNVTTATGTMVSPWPVAVDGDDEAEENDADAADNNSQQAAAVHGYVSSRRWVMRALDSAEEATTADSGSPSSSWSRRMPEIAPTTVDWPGCGRVLTITFDAAQHVPLARALLHKGTAAMPLPLPGSSTVVPRLLVALLKRAARAEALGDIAGGAHPGVCFVRAAQLPALVAALYDDQRCDIKNDNSAAADDDKDDDDDDDESDRIDWLFPPRNLRPNPRHVDLIDPSSHRNGGEHDLTLEAADLAAGTHTAATDVFCIALFAAWLWLGPEALAAILRAAAAAAAIEQHPSTPLTFPSPPSTVDSTLRTIVGNQLERILPKAVGGAVASGLASIPSERPSAWQLQRIIATAMIDETTTKARVESPEAFLKRRDDPVSWLELPTEDFEASLIKLQQGPAGGASPTTTGADPVAALTTLLENAKKGGATAASKPAVVGAVLQSRVRKYAEAIAASARAEVEREQAASDRQSMLRWLQADDGVLKILWHVEGLSDISFYAAVLEAFAPTAAKIDEKLETPEFTGDVEVRYFGPTTVTAAAQPPVTGARKKPSTDKSKGPSSAPTKDDAAAGNTLPKLSELRFMLDTSHTGPDSVVAAIKTYGGNSGSGDDVAGAMRTRFAFQHDNDLKAVSTAKRDGEVGRRESPEAWTSYRRLRWGRAIENYLLHPLALLRLFSVRVPMATSSVSAAWAYAMEAELSFARLYFPVQQPSSKDPVELPPGEAWTSPGPSDSDRALPSGFALRLLKAMTDTSADVELLTALATVYRRAAGDGLGEVRRFWCPTKGDPPEDDVLAMLGLPLSSSTTTAPPPPLLANALKFFNDDEAGGVAAVDPSPPSGEEAVAVLDARTKGRFVQDSGIGDLLARLGTFAATICADAAIARDDNPEEAAAAAVANAGGGSRKPNRKKLARAYPPVAAPPLLVRACTLFLAKMRRALSLVHLEGIIDPAASPASLFRCPVGAAAAGAPLGFIPGCFSEETPRPLTDAPPRSQTNGNDGSKDGEEGAATVAARTELVQRVRCLSCGRPAADHTLLADGSDEGNTTAHNKATGDVDALVQFVTVMSYSFDSHAALELLHGGDTVLGAETASIGPPDGSRDWFWRFLTARARTTMAHLRALYPNPQDSRSFAERLTRCGEGDCSLCAAHVADATSATPPDVMQELLRRCVEPLMEARRRELADVANKALATCGWLPAA